MTLPLALASVVLVAATLGLAARMASGPSAWRVTAAAIRKYVLVGASYRFRIAVIAFNVAAFFVAILLVGRGYVAPALGAALQEQGRQVLVYVVIGVVAWPTVWAGYRASASTIRGEQELGTLETTAATPAGLETLTFASFVTGMLSSLFWASLLLMLGLLVVPGMPPLRWEGVPVVLAAVVLAALFLWGVGLVFGALTAYYKELGPAATILQYALILLSGVYVPLTILPPAVAAVGATLPLTVAFALVREALFVPLVLEWTVARLALVAVAALGAVAVGAAAFRRGVEAARRAGVLSGY